MNNARISRLSITLCMALAAVLLFNGYYFFIRRNVGPSHYFHRLLSSPSDGVLSLPMYLDLREEYERLNAKLPPRPHIVFVGDSITKRFNTEEFFHHENVLNRGIFSDTTAGLLARIDENINNITIDRLFILIGYNDLKLRTNDEIVRNILSIVNKSHARTKFVQSLLPVAAGQTSAINKRIDGINAHLDQMAAENGYVFVDLNWHFKNKSNILSSSYTRDGVHLNYAGYQLWHEIIEARVLSAL